MDFIEKLTCLHCGQEFVNKRSNLGGRRKLFCSDRCRNKHSEKPRRVGIRAFVCKHCGKTFEAGHKRKFCSVECRKAHSQKPWVPAAVRINYCKHCGKATKRPVFCSRECAFAYSKAETVKHQKLLAIKQLIRHLKKRAKELEEKPKKVRYGVCEVCGATFEYHMGRGRRYCSEACRRKSEQAMAARRASMAFRRYKRRNGIDSSLNEYVDPYEIFERDGWKCQICGGETPRELRGKNKPNSPELDHITAVCRGGLHNRQNLQCCCRSCNMEKALYE